MDFSGGEPLLHPDFLKKDFRLLKYIKKHKNIRFSIHTNGIELNKIIVDNIYKHFSRIGISVNSLNFQTWNKITNLNGLFSEDCQLKKFNKMIKNIKYLGSKGIGHKVFIKSVVMRGINDSEEELRSILEF
ncbi:MAG TPA: radical SAM protein [bacterium]|nr:radical SAM protein [bacterium]